VARVLVVDDEFGIAEILAAVLEDEGHEVAMAINGRMALASIEKSKPDLIITDFMMPLMDGPALVRAVQAQPGLSAIPIVMMSSMPEETIAERVAGHVQFLRKPFRIDDVIAIAAKFLPA
jgi:CheY-like chemotaxis protein